MGLPEAPEVYSAREIARAADVPQQLVETLIARGEIKTVGASLPAGLPLSPSVASYVDHAEAVRVVRALRTGNQVGGTPHTRPVILNAPDRPRRAAVSLLVSTSLHALVALCLISLASMKLVSADTPTELLNRPEEPARLVFLALPGPGGGGGGGGRRMPTPVPRAERKGRQTVSSPLPARMLPPARPLPQPVEPPPEPLDARPVPPVAAPVLTARADPRDREGGLSDASAPIPASAGPGVDGGTGSGRGTGVGEGQGPGIGPGEGGGIGGGPYRPGSGVQPPRLLREVRADYTEEARRAHVTGEVLLEIIVRRDGSVGDVRVLRGLGFGLDQRAVQAVRQWQFAAARLKGAPVDVVVEVSVEFKFR